MQDADAAGAHPLMTILNSIANEIAALEALGQSVDSAITQEYITSVAEVCRVYLDELASIPGVMTGVEPWRPDR